MFAQVFGGGGKDTTKNDDKNEPKHRHQDQDQDHTSIHTFTETDSPPTGGDDETDEKDEKDTTKKDRMLGLYVANDRFKVRAKLGEGSFGSVYSARDVEGALFAIKSESKSLKKPQLRLEYRLYRRMSPGFGIPSVHWYGRSPDERNNLMVMDILGDNLEDLKDRCPDKKLGLKTVLMLADQMIARLAYFHSKNFIHRDIKPENFVMGHDSRPKMAHVVHIIDFGLSKRYMSSSGGVHIPYRDDKQLTGTPRYTSVNTHLGIEQSRRDDMESLGYVLVYLMKGRLPWQGIRVKNKEVKHKLIKDKKVQVPPEELCSGLPQEFLVYIRYCRGLDFEQEPDYVYMRRLFRNLFWHNNFEWDHGYDWVRGCRRGH